MAAINFEPDSPSNGDTFVANGVTYTYDGTKWKTTINSNAFLPLTGGTLSGNLNMGTNDLTVGDVTASGTASLSGLTYPTSDGTAGQYLQTDGAGALSFQTVTSGMTATGPAFHAKINSNYAGSHNTTSVIQYSNEVFDTANCYDTSTYRFTPTVAGYYLLLAQYTLSNTNGDSVETAIDIFKNGGPAVNGALDGRQAWGGYSGIQTSAILYANGSTDYFDARVYFYDSNSENFSLNGGYRNNFFGALIREA